MVNFFENDPERSAAAPSDVLRPVALVTETLTPAADALKLFPVTVMVPPSTAPFGVYVKFGEAAAWAGRDAHTHSNPAMGNSKIGCFTVLRVSWRERR